MGFKIRKMNFRSWGAYKRWLRYGHATGVFRRTPGHVKVSIRGKPHKVKHSKRKGGKK
jgi:gamma-glutamyl:cysteine ligase YbdK (ATP-grasp superfamily)